MQDIETTTAEPSPECQNLERRSMRAAVWVFGFELSFQVVQVLLGIVLVRLLTPADFGIWGMLAFFWGLYILFLTGGFGVSLIHKKEITQLDLSTVFYFNVCICWVMCLAVYFLAPYIAIFLKEPVLEKILHVLAWLMLLVPLASIQMVLLSRKLKQGVISLCGFVSVLISIPVAILLAKNGWGVWALVWQWILVFGTKAIAVTLYERWLPSAQFSFRIMKEHFRYGIGFVGAQVLAIIEENLHCIIVGRYYNATQVGYLDRARAYSVFLPLSIVQSLNRVALPMFARMRDDPQKMDRTFRQALAISFSVTIILPSMLATLSYPFVTLVLTEKWLPIIPFLWVFTFTYALSPLYSLNSRLMLGNGHSGQFFAIQFTHKVVLVAGIFAMVSFGVLPIACAMGLAYVFAIFLYIMCGGGKYGCSLWSQFRICLPYFALACIACAIAKFLSLILFPIFPWVGLIVPAIVGGLVYFLLNGLFRTESYRMAVEVLNRQPIVVRVKSWWLHK